MKHSLILAFCGIFTLAGCVPMLGKGQYATFDDTPGIEVVEVGRPKGVKMTVDRAIRYKIDDEQYTINIDTSENGRIGQFSAKRESRVLDLKVVNRTRQQIDQACLFLVIRPGYDAYQLRLQDWNEGCESYKSGIHSFDVAVMQGEQVLGVNTIVFELKKSGYYIWYDAV